jgi:reductive dehalogenase
MKAANLSEAGRDIDDVIGSPKADWKRPWWVRTVSEPTIDIDWSKLQRFNLQKNQYINHFGKEEQERRNEKRRRKITNMIREGNSYYSLPALALNKAVRMGAVGTSFLGFYNDPLHAIDYSGNTAVITPEILNVPKYEGTPEANSKLVRAAMRVFGANEVGFLEIDDRISRLIYSHDWDGKKIDFENVDKAYETNDKRVIPNKAHWIIVFTVQMSLDLLKHRMGRAPTPYSAAATGSAYARARMIMDDLQIFLHVLGYQGLMSTWFNGLAIAPALGIMAGIGEQSRLNRLISPEYGPLVRVFRLITDLPLAPTSPIDAGIMRFCRTCKKCAEECPSGTLSKDTEPTWEIKGSWNNPGHKSYFEDSLKCMSYWSEATTPCSTCISVCPFSKNDGSFIHDFVKAMIAKTPVFNSFFVKMDSLLGYGKAKDRQLWGDFNLPPYGIKNHPSA